MTGHKNAPGGELAGDPEGTDESGKLPGRIERYSVARQRATQMVAHLADRGDHPVEYVKLRDCGNYLVFRHYFTVGKVRLSAGHFCKKHLLCPLCAIRRGAKTLASYLERFRVLQEERPRLRPYLVTVTVRNGESLQERFEHLQGSLQRLHNRRRHWLKGSKYARWTEAARAQGAVWTYEVTNQGNGWHPHVHAIWLCESAPDQDVLRSEWETITQDSFMVDVRPLDQDDPAEGFAEVFKYAMKFAELSLADNLHAYGVLTGRRLVGSFGCFRGVQVPDVMTDELLDELPYIELFYRYLPGVGYALQPVNAAREASAEGQHCTAPASP